MDKRVALYLRLDSWLYWTIVQRLRDVGMTLAGGLRTKRYAYSLPANGKTRFGVRTSKIHKKKVCCKNHAMSLNEMAEIQKKYKRIINRFQHLFFQPASMNNNQQNSDTKSRKYRQRKKKPISSSPTRTGGHYLNFPKVRHENEIKSDLILVRGREKKPGK